MATNSLTKIKAEIARLEKQAQAILRQEAVKAIDTIQKLMVRYQITLDDLGNAISTKLDGAAERLSGSAKPAKTRKGKKTARAKPAPKYQNPATGETWSGMGRAPAWIRAALEKGKQDKFLIGAEGAAPAKSARKSAATKSNGKARASAKPAAAAKKAGKAAASKTAKTSEKASRKPAPKAAKKTAKQPNGSASPKVSEGVASAAAE